MARARKGSDADATEAAGQARDVDETPGIDDVLAQLEGVVAELEGGDLPLEKALEQFERGVSLARKGGRLLDAVEERVERLLADRDETVPFETEDD